MGLPERADQEPEPPPGDLPRQHAGTHPRHAPRLRQSLADIEHAFSREISLERRRRDSLRRTAEKRTHKRQVERRHKRGSMRFALLVATLVLTAAIVTVVMFRTLYLLLS